MIDQTNEAAMRARADQLLEAQRDKREREAETSRGDVTDDRPPPAAEGAGDIGTPAHEDGISTHPAQDGPVEVKARQVTPG